MLGWTIEAEDGAMATMDLSNEIVRLRAELEAVSSQRDLLLCEVAGLRRELEMSELRQLQDDRYDHISIIFPYTIWNTPRKGFLTTFEISIIFLYKIRSPTKNRVWTTFKSFFLIYIANILSKFLGFILSYFKSV